MKNIKIGILETNIVPWRKGYIGHIHKVINLLSDITNKYKFNIVGDALENECDICFYDLFSIKYDDLPNIFYQVKGNPIFILDEHSEPPGWPFFHFYEQNKDTIKEWTNNFKNYSISLYEDSNTNLLYLPCLFSFNTIKDSFYNRSKNDLIEKNKFALWIASNMVERRKNKIDYINEHYMHIDYYGKNIWYGNDKNNKGVEIPRIGDKYLLLDLYKNYKFSFAFENTPSTGNKWYITEKISNGYRNNVVPIYWGSDHITDFFNKNSFINCNNMTNEQMISSIKKVNEDKELYEYMYFSYPFKDKNFDYDLYFKEKLIKFYTNIFEQV